MTRQLPISDADIVQVVHLLGEVAGMTCDLVTRRRHLMEGLGRLIDADVWLWIASRFDQRRYPGPVMVMDGGWIDDDERAQFYRYNVEPEATAAALSVMASGVRHSTDVFDATHPGWQDGLIERKYLRRMGMRHYMLSLYQVEDQMLSGIGLHRREGKPPYTVRETALVHLVIGQIDWLHRAGLLETPAAANVIGLTPRQTEVLIHLLAGDSIKRIAEKLEIGEYTVKDHAKALHRHFNVASRAELLAKFIAGKTS